MEYPFKHRDRYRALEKEAREAGRGLWAPEKEKTGAASPATRKVIPPELIEPSPVKPKSHELHRIAHIHKFTVLFVVISGSYTENEIIDIGHQLRDKYARDRYVQIRFHNSEKAMLDGEAIATYTSESVDETIKEPRKH
jgi:hypothetical protein